MKRKRSGRFFGVNKKKWPQTRLHPSEEASREEALKEYIKESDPKKVVTGILGVTRSLPEYFGWGYF